MGFLKSNVILKLRCNLYNECRGLPLNFQRALHESTYKIHHVIQENASVSDVQYPAVLGRLVGVRLMNV
jgi:hypothetical protein